MVVADDTISSAPQSRLELSATLKTKMSGLKEQSWDASLTAAWERRRSRLAGRERYDRIIDYEFGDLPEPVGARNYDGLEEIPFERQKSVVNPAAAK